MDGVGEELEELEEEAWRMCEMTSQILGSSKTSPPPRGLVPGLVFSNCQLIPVVIARQIAKLSC